MTIMAVPERCYRWIGRAFWAAVIFGIVSVIESAVGCATYQAWRYPCVSRESGLRGEVKRTAEGKLLYFNAQCWTSKPMPPRDTPF
jgi:hypothetical protein